MAILWGDELLSHQISRDHDGGVPVRLPLPSLQHEQALVLNRELEVLHVLVMLLESSS